MTTIVSALFKFADGGKMLHSVSDKDEIDLVQNDLDKLATWSKDWQMPFNLDKCKVMHVGGNNQEPGTYLSVKQQGNSQLRIGERSWGVDKQRSKVRLPVQQSCL